MDTIKEINAKHGVISNVFLTTGKHLTPKQANQHAKTNNDVFMGADVLPYGDNSVRSKPDNNPDNNLIR